MGDCGSRPDSSEIENHIQEKNTKNDKYFKTVPFYQSHYNFLLTETNLKTLLSRKHIYERQYRDYIKRSEYSNDTIPSIKELTIEVQKGLYLHKSSCCNQEKPYVEVLLHPNGPFHQTFAADPFKPIWYRVVQIKTLLEFVSVKFNVKLQGSGEIIGNTEISLIDVCDQFVHENWYPLDGSYPKSSIKIRIQYISSEKKLYKELADQCLQYSSEIMEAIKKIQS
jgi:hypothetical protein